MPPAQATGLVLVRPEKRTASDKRALAQLGGLPTQIQTVWAHFASFAALLGEQRATPGAPAQLPEWIGRALSSGVPERTAFATNLRPESVAVCRTLTLPFS